MSKVVLITGASSGLGKACAEWLAAQGYRVYGACRRPEAVASPYPMLALDLRERASIDRAVAEIIDREGRLDVAINNAGIGMAGPLEQARLDNLTALFDTNVFGALGVMQAVIPHMRAQGGGLLVNISSIGGVVNLPFRAAYCASKAALNALTNSLRMEVGAFGVQACAVLVGDMRTPIGERRIKDYRPDDEAYREAFERVYAAINHDVERGIAPELVAQRIERIVRRKKVRPVYAVGKPLQEVSLLAQRLLPAPLFEKIILKYSGL